MTWELLTVFTAGISTLAILSFLLGENPLYRFFEHLFIGLAAGIGPVLTIKEFLWPKIFAPMLGFDLIQFPDGTSMTPYQPAALLYIFPLCIGSLYYFVYSPRFSWLSKLAIGTSLGVSAGLAVKGTFVELIPQLIESCKPLLVFDENVLNIWLSISNTIFVVTLVTVMLYFLFTFALKSAETGGKGRNFGRYLLMICFGAFFGSTVMARMALLVDRVDFLIHDWLIAIATIFGMSA